MQYEIVFKGDGWCSCYTCLPQTVPVAQTAQKTVAAPGTGTPKDQRLLMNTWPETRQQYKHTCKQEKTLRNSTTIHENIKQNKARTILHVTTIAWT